MRWALVALLALGCASYEVQVTPPNFDAPTMVVKGHQYGRGCVAIDTQADGSTSAIIAQDGSTDWIVGRMLHGLGELVAPVFGGNNDPNAMQEPDAATGCGQIMGDEATE